MSLEDVEDQIPPTILTGITGASLIVLFVFSFMSVYRSLKDFARYGFLYPYFWFMAVVFLLLYSCCGTAGGSRIYPSDGVGESFWKIQKKNQNQWLSNEENFNFSGLYNLCLFLSLTVTLGLILYACFFLIFSFLEVVSCQFDFFVKIWILSFLVICVLCWNEVFVRRVVLTSKRTLKSFVNNLEIEEGCGHDCGMEDFDVKKHQTEAFY